MVLEKLRERFRKEPLEAAVENAHEAFREEKQEELERAREMEQEFQEELRGAMDELREELEELEGYTDVENRQVIEDVVDNVASDRKRMVENFEIPGDPAELRERINGFLEEFRTMKHKENEVLKVIGDEKKPVFNALERVEELEEELEEFVKGSYRELVRRENLEELAEKREELEQELEELEERIDGIDLEGARGKIKEVQERLDELHDGEMWEEYQELKDRVQEREEELESVRKDIEKQANRMERGLKKLLYEKSVEARDVLEEVRDGKIERLMEREAGEVEEAIENAVESLPGDLLGERQEQKFRDAAGQLKRFGEKIGRMEHLGEKVEGLEEKLEEHAAPAKENELASELDRLQERLREKRVDREELRDRKEEARKELERVKDRIAEEMDEAFERGVKLS